MQRTDTTFYLLRQRLYPAKISLVIPMYNEEPVVPFLRAAVEAFLNELHAEVEIILVNDGSKDSTLRMISEWAQQDPRIKILNFSRNFGHQIACTAAWTMLGATRSYFSMPICRIRCWLSTR